MNLNGGTGQVAGQHKDWIRELATMITCIREDVSPHNPIVSHNTPTPGIENALYRVIK